MRSLLALLIAVPLAVPGCGPSVDRGTACKRTNRQIHTAHGLQSSRTVSLPAKTTLAARGTVWTRAGNYQVSVLGDASAACMVGGTMVGEWSDTDSWSKWHGRGALRVSQPGFSVFGIHVFNAGDGFKAKDDAGGAAQDFLLQGSWIQHAHDDCVENDYLHSGVIRDDLLDGCYVMFSARPWRSGFDGRRNKLVIDEVVGSLEPMKSVFRGPSPGTGGIFKWSDRAPGVVLTDNVFLIRQPPNHGDLAPPPGPLLCRGNTIVWAGKGAFPETAAWRSRCPDTVITTDLSRYTKARASWLARHPKAG